MERLHPSLIPWLSEGSGYPSPLVYAPSHFKIMGSTPIMVSLNLSLQMKQYGLTSSDLNEETMAKKNKEYNEVSPFYSRGGPPIEQSRFTVTFEPLVTYTCKNDLRVHLNSPDGDTENFNCCTNQWHAQFKCHDRRISTLYPGIDTIPSYGFLNSKLTIQTQNHRLQTLKSEPYTLRTLNHKPNYPNTINISFKV